MIDFNKTLDEALNEIEYLNIHKIFSVNDLCNKFDRLTELYNENTVLTLARYDDEMGLACSPPPIIGYCLEKSANAWNNPWNEVKNVKYHLWFGKKGFIFTVEANRKEKWEDSQQVNSSELYPKFDAHKLFSNSNGYWNNEVKNATLFFDDPSNVSFMYLLRNTNLVKDINR